MKSLDDIEVYKWRGRSPCGERGLKCQRQRRADSARRRSPCGERGLKYIIQHAIEGSEKSLPVRGAWIEMPLSGRGIVPFPQSLPVRGAWIEICLR